MKTLIAYATKYGCTEKCASRIAEEIKGDVELLDLRKTPSVNLADFDTVIIGGSVYIGKMQKAVSEFCSRHIGELRNKRLGLFICGMAEGEAIETELKASFPAELLERAVAKEFLGGEFLVDSMSFFDRLMVKNAAKVTSNVSNILDDKIIKFAQAMKQTE
jgi:menaquinone-dependent protoporphyrinogen oxidase